jgi:hypothetical protein
MENRIKELVTLIADRTSTSCYGAVTFDGWISFETTGSSRLRLT